MKAPLAERLRPQNLNDWIGHRDILAPGMPLFEAIQADRLFSFILYAPAGTGKTSLCLLIKKYSKARFIAMSAVSSGIKDIKAAIDEAKAWSMRESRQTVVFIDEIHRFNKSQQDALLHAVERGEIILIGATTENPSFELNAALLSRLRVFRMQALSQENLVEILKRARALLETDSESAVGALSDEMLIRIATLSQGDARIALNVLELGLINPSLEKFEQLFQSKVFAHDKTGDLHYQVVSAFIKSMRAGEVDAALYYMARLWESGEDPLFIARRMVIFASEDVGNADLRGIALANAVKNSVEFVGRPECYYALAQGVIYLSKAAKSREAGDRFQRALDQVKRTGAQAKVPDFLVNANSQLDRDLGRGRKRAEDESFLPLEV